MLKKSIAVDNDGTVISDSYTMPSNFLCCRDGDLGREVLDNVYVSKWNSTKTIAI